MLLQTFHLFPLLPLEIRFHIYLLATPHRFIHIREQSLEDQEDFLEYHRTNILPVDFKLHPSLSHFAHEWRHTIPYDITTTQTTLHRFGFTTSKPVSQPWTPSPECPEIPLHTLTDCPGGLLWLLCRKSYLYSKAPIPVFLHVNTESRSFLMAYGYKLGFSTRSSGPRTWVCWKDDVVYLDMREEYNEHRLVTRDEWGLNCFMPADLKSIKRIALERISGIYIDDPPRNVQRVSKLLRLCGGIEELFMVKSNLDVIYEQARANSLKGVVHAEGRFRGWIDCDEADAHYTLSLGCLFLAISSAGYENCMLKGYIKENEGSGIGYFDMVGDVYREELKIIRDGIMGGEKTSTWKIPTIKVVHVGKSETLKRWFKIRQRYWKGAEESELRDYERTFRDFGIVMY